MPPDFDGNPSLPGKPAVPTERTEPAAVPLAPAPTAVRTYLLLYQGPTYR